MLCDVLQGPLLQIEVEGTGFLYRQVRNMVLLLQNYASYVAIAL